MTIPAVEQHSSKFTQPSSRTLLILAFFISFISASAQQPQRSPAVPPRVAQARRFLAQRSWPRKAISTSQPRLSTVVNPQISDAPTAIWQPLGPTAVSTSHYGPVTGRVSSIAIDPSDPTGNKVVIGTTGGGVWASQNAATDSSVTFTPLTDVPSAFTDGSPASISIGAITMQPGSTGVILAGTGDPNDALDSYYGFGLLRSTDNGNSWSSIRRTGDNRISFQGEGFAGFAWSTSNPQLVVAAVAEAYEGALVNAPIPYASSAGLYYSTDAGATWSFATISDGPGHDVQGPNDSFPQPNGNSATSVAWNPVRGLFIAAVRFHGYYQSTDGVTWTRMANQPGAGLTTQLCPANPGTIGSLACPMFRGALAVNPSTGDTFAWTVDLHNQDLGIWQDTCNFSANTCSNQTITFSKQWNTVPLQTSTMQGATTIANGDYNLVLAAVPSQQDTLLFAGANDLWRCSLAVGCLWRNTTNSFSCMSAGVAPYQHALAWNPANPQEIFVGNDSGLWRSADAVSQTGSLCSSSDALHFQNLNVALGSLAEVESMSQIIDSPYTMLTGLGANGSAGIKGTIGPASIWPQVFNGEGGAVAIDPSNSSNWYVNSGAGVSIYRCSQPGACTSSDFGATPVVSNASVGGDGYTMAVPAPFIVDPLDHTQLLVATCRLWRGPADGSPWSSANAISTTFDGERGQSYCSGSPMIRTLAALPIGGGREVIYVGMYGSANGGSTLGGHVFKQIYDPNALSLPPWQDLTFSPVLNMSVPFNTYAYDVSSIYIDPHDPTGNTAYVTIGAMSDQRRPVYPVYQTTDGGAHWNNLTSNLPISPANGIVIDPQDANTAYVATDMRVYATRSISGCIVGTSNCWSVFGVGLPFAPVTQLNAAPSDVSPDVLVAGTYGRGIWQIPLWTAGTQQTMASATPSSLSFPSQIVGTKSTTQTITVTNTGGVVLNITSITAGADFTETDTCVGVSVNAGRTCSIQVSFVPAQIGAISEQVSVSGNIAGAPITIAVSGTGASQGPITATPGTLDFGQVQIGALSSPLSVTVENTTASAIPVTSINVTPPFQLAGSACGSSLPAKSDCQLTITFTPVQAGLATGVLSLTDTAGTQTIALSGTGMTPPTDAISPTSLAFSSTATGQLSNPQIVTLTNGGDMPLTSISVNASTGFQASSTCSTTLPGGAACSISVVFAPTSGGNISGILSISDSLRTQTVALSGTAVSPPILSATPTQVSFPAQLVGNTSAPLPVIINNKGAAPLFGLGFQITGQNSSSFASNTAICPATLNAGDSCTAQVAFTPSTSGQLNAAFVISSSTRGVNPVQVTLTGVGQQGSGIAVAPGVLSFTQPVIGQASAPQTVTLTNTSSVTATALVLTTAAPFSIAQTTCGTSLAAGASCTAAIVFTPSANATISGALNITSSGLSSTASVVLNGVGGAAGSLAIQPSSLNFPTTGVGSTSTIQPVTLTNSGAIVLNSLAVSASTGFQVASTTCGSTLDLGTSCTVQLAFAPTAAGQQSGTLTISSASLLSNQQVTLSGMGFDFSIASSGPSSQSVASGQAATYSITVTPMSGSTGTFAFSCSALPGNSACTFNPPSETLAPNTTGTVAVKIATGISTASALNTLRSSRALPPICALLLLPLTSVRRRPKLFLLLLLFSITFPVTSCAGAGGGGGAAPPSGGSSGNNTPAGTYSVVVTATSNGIAHKTTLTLTVD